MPNNWTEILNQQGRNLESYAKTNTPAIEQESVSMEDECQARARRIRRLSPGDRQHAQMQLAARIKVMEKNLERGYTEWLHALATEKRVLELSNIGVLD